MINAWHEFSFNQVIKKLKSSDEGISLEKAKAYLEKHGLNEIVKKKSFVGLRLFFTQFRSVFIVFLIFAAEVSFLAGERTDSYIITIAILLNILFGFVQERKAEKILSSLESSLALEVHVVREGEEKIILAKKLVPGDIVFLKQGDRVAADMRLGYAKNLATDEAALTGESMPVDKDTQIVKGNTILAERKNMVYQGTLISRGEGKGIVVTTGKDTELGQISVTLSEQKREETPLQKQIQKLSKLIGYFVAVAFFIILIDGLIMTGPANFSEIFLLAVAVAVSAIPEGLIVAVTVILAVGMKELSKRKAYLRRLSAAETLGGVTVILTDKTGTLTEAKMAVDNVFYESSSKNKNLLYKALIFAGSARVENPHEKFADWRYVGSPTEQALLKKAVSEVDPKFYFNREKFVLDSIPFDSSNKFQVKLTKGKANNFLYFVGSPESALEKSVCVKAKKGTKKMTPKMLRNFQSQYKGFASQGLRVLGVAYRKVSPDFNSLEGKEIEKLVFVGFVVLKDPLRKEVKRAIKSVRRAGIKTVIVTGDHALTAKAIAADLGFDTKKGEILSGDEISRLSEPELRKRLKNAIVFARVSPYDKIRILQAYQKNGEVVAMTGDGINDALALKGADIGIALGSGQEVAREASDLVLLDDNFKNIVSAIRQGRIIFDNIKKVVVYLLTGSFSEVLLVGGAIILGMPIPLLPTQILWINLVEDGLPSFALALEPGEKGVMKRKPRDPKSSLLDREMKFIILAIGLLVDFLLFGIYVYLVKTGYEINHIRTMIFVGLTVQTLFISFAVKSLRKSIFKMNLLNNKYLLFSTGLSMVFLVASIYLPFFQKMLHLTYIGKFEWSIIIGLGVIQLAGIEFVKWIFNHKNNPLKV